MNHVPTPAGRHTPATAPRTRTSRLAVIAICGATVLLVVLGLFLWTPQRSTVASFPQAAEVTYADGGTHYVVLQRVRAPIAALGLGGDGTSALDHYEIVIGRDPGAGYGHPIRIEAGGADPTQLTVLWTSDGVWLDYPTGHRLFVPAKSFTGGR
ncbi:hypothetical protein ACK8GG_08770 [Micromonosporaceae bacterium DT55]|uniref:hypothetical protein n=1 Tax=Melissospora conviva TaxID=3388432 RepID=UPI003C1B8315